MAKGLQSEVEEEEDPPRSLSLKASFIIVLAIHLGIAGALAYMPKMNAMAMEKKDAEFLKKEPQYTGVEEQKYPTPPPNSKPIKTMPQQKYTTHYVVKEGDTLESIAKKYKLNRVRLQQLNNITHPNHIRVGMTLKFM